MRKRAFTLLETMIALVVVASAIAASSQASRVLFRSAAQSELVAQASMLADDAAASLQRTGAILVANSLDVQAYFALGATTSRQILPYRRHPNNGDFYTQYYCLDNLQQAGNLATQCGTVRSDVLTNGASYTAVTMFAGGGEVIAVNRTAPSSQTRSVIDLTTTTSVGGDEIEDTDQNWDFYRRNIVVRSSNQLIGAARAVEAVVTVTSLRDSSISVQRSFLISLQP